MWDAALLAWAGLLRWRLSRLVAGRRWSQGHQAVVEEKSAVVFAQIFDVNNNSTSLLTKGGHVEEREGVTRRQAGWPRARVFCLALYAHHASRVKVGKTAVCLEERGLDH
jgi:hypothetical protein